MNTPVLRHVANLWTLIEHPSRKKEWPIDRKLKAIKEAGFDGICWKPISGLKEGILRHGLFFLGGMASGNAAEFPKLLLALKKTGARHVNVQLAGDEIQAPEALELALSLNREAKKLGLE
jgi:hypothetical protein